MEALKPLIIRLTYDPKQSELALVIDGLLKMLGSMQTSYGLDCLHVALKDIEGSDAQSIPDGASAAKKRLVKFESILHKFSSKKAIRSSSREVGLPENQLLHKDNKVVILSDYPSSKEDLKLMILDSSSSYPILDGVVMFLSQSHGNLKCSYRDMEYDQGDVALISDKLFFTEKNLTSDLLLDQNELNLNITYDEIDCHRKQDETGALFSKDDKILLDEFAALITNLAVYKNRYQTWASNIETISVETSNDVMRGSLLAMEEASMQDYSKEWAQHPVYSSYVKAMDSFSALQQCTPACALYCIVEATVQYHSTAPSAKSAGFSNQKSERLASNAPSTDTTPKDVTMTAMTPLDRASLHSEAGPINRAIGADDDFLVSAKPARGSRVSTRKSSQQEGSRRASVENNVERSKEKVERRDPFPSYLDASKLDQLVERVFIALPQMDQPEIQAVRFLAPGAAMAGQPGDKYPVLKHREKCADLLHFHKTVAYSGYQLQLLGGHGLPLRPTLSELDRGIRETELLTFTSLSLTDFHRAHQLQLFDKITASTRAQLVNFTGTIRNLSGGGFDYSLLKRRYIRQLHALTLRHLLAKEWVKDPVLRRAYDPLADRLLLALCWPHHDRRSHKEEWCPLDSYRSRVTFREYFTAVENQNYPLTVQVALRSFMDVNKKEMQKHKVITHTFTPADRSIIKLRHALSSNDAWLSIYSGDTVFGLRRLSRPSRRHSSTHLSVVANAAAVVRRNSRSGSISSGISQATLASSIASSVSAAVQAAVQPPVNVSAHSVPQTKRKSTLLSLHSALDGSSLGCFFCETEDGVRITAGSIPAASPNMKPDKKGTVYFGILYPNALHVLVRSNGTVRITSPPERHKLPDIKATDMDAILMGPSNHGTEGAGTPQTVAQEVSRFISGRCLVRTFGSTSPIKSDVYRYDGSRLITRGADLNPVEWYIYQDPKRMGSKSGPSRGRYHERSKTYDHSVVAQGGARGANAQNSPSFARNSFLFALIQNAPSTWQYAELTASGQVKYYSGSPAQGSTSGGKVVADTGIQVQVPELENMFVTYTDAATGASVQEFKDGRVFVHFSDGLTQFYFPDGTLISRTVGREGQHSLVHIERLGHPAVEIDEHIDNVSTEHSKGKQVPISRGGDRVRMRLVGGDGSAVVVKYDTRVTSSSNGSLKLVRRDRTSISAVDGGEVLFSPRICWSTKDEQAFIADGVDELCAPPTSTSVPSNGDDLNGPGGDGETSNLLTADRLRDNETAGLTAAKIGGTVSFVPTPRIREKPTPGKASKSPASRSGLSKNLSKFIGEESRKDPGGRRSVAVPGPNRKIAGMESKRSSKSKLTEQTSSQFSFPMKEGFAANDNEAEDMLPKKALESKYIFKISESELTCKVEDNEYNSFQIDLQNPAQPTVVLAGEVAGLKPKAVASNPVEPLLFVVDRKFEAMELMRMQDVADLERQVGYSDDLTKTRSDLLHQPPDLGGGTLHSYLKRRRVGLYEEAAFSEVFPYRRWHERELATAAALTLQKVTPPNMLWPNSRFPHTPVLTEQTDVIEIVPLSDEGYKHMSEAVTRWESWRTQRVATINRFTVDDPRGHDDINLETDVRKRLRKLYKAAKSASAAKRGSNPGGGPSPSPTAMSMLEAHEEGAEDFPEDDDESDEGVVEVQPEDIEIAASFDRYKVNYAEGISRVPLEDLRAALVHICNRHVSPSEISEALESINLSMSEAVDLEEFRHIYFRLSGNEDTDSPEREQEPDAESTWRGPVGTQSATSIHPGGGSILEGSTSSSNSKRPVEKSYFWASKFGQSLAQGLPVDTAPPLGQRPVSWKENERM